MCTSKLAELNSLSEFIGILDKLESPSNPLSIGRLFGGHDYCVLPGHSPVGFHPYTSPHSLDRHSTSLPALE